MFAQGLGFLMNYFTGLPIIENFFVSITNSIEEAPHDVPLASFPVIVIAFYYFANYFASTLSMFPVSF
jgi:di/tricarboxylate transporter